MYTTFVGLNNDQQHAKSTSTSARGRKTKRHQVSRACEPCRANRAKCSDTRPCNACVDRGYQCTDTPSGSRSSISTAIEVDELRSKIQDLERRLHAHACPSPPNSNANTNGSTSPVRPLTGDRASLPLKENRESHPTKASAETHLANPRSAVFAPTAFSRRLGFPVPLSTEKSPFEHDNRDDGAITSDERLPKSAQLYYIGNFWLYLHYVMPVLCERDTDAHFESLWPSSPGVSSMAQKRRRSSPLIDIILACAMQHDSKSRVHLGARQSSPDTQILYFERSQTMLLGDALCSPDLMNVQALILMSHYLTHQGKMQKASGYFAMATRMAMAMHLHHDPPNFLTPTAQELRRRIWWYIYTSEAIDAVANGRVWTLDVPGLDVRMMADDAETAILSCTKFGKDDGTGTTWLSYSVQMVSLYQLAVKGLVGCRNGSDENKEDAVVESLEKWAKNVPVNLRTLGTFGDDADLATPSFDETPFAVSPDKYRLKIDTSKPQWLQKQRLLLELHFRHAVMLFCRHAIESQLDRKDTGDDPSPAATKCIQHALSISRMLLQVLTETALLESQSDALHMLWNSSLTLVAFSMAFGSRARGRHITETLQLNCEVFGQFAGMICAAGLARSQLQQFLQQMGVVTVEASPNETSNSSTAQQFSSAMKQMTSVAPFSIEESPKAAFHRQSITDATAHWASQFGPTQGMPLDDDMSGSHLPPLSVPANGMAWSMGSSMPAYSNSESYRPWTSDGTDGIDMDNFMFDLSSVTSVGQSTSGHV